MSKNKIAKFIIVCCTFSFISCSTSKVSYFEIGSGGGFTGKYIEYKVCSDGKIFDISNGQQEKLFATFDKKKIKEIFKELDKINVPQVNFSFPGNMTYYVRTMNNDKTYEIKWGDFKKSPPQNILDFYNKVWNDIRPK